MKKKLVLFIIIIVIVLALFLLLTQKKVYTIKLELVDEYSPDIKLIVQLNGKEFTDYKYIKYNNGNDKILCYSKNATVNKFEIEDEKDLIIVLNNDKEKVAEVLK